MWSRALTTLVFVLSVSVCHADLTAKEKADGWIMLCDGATDFGWHSGGGEVFTVSHGALTAPAGGGRILTNTEFGDYDLSFDCMMEGTAGAKLILRIAPGATIPALSLALKSNMSRGKSSWTNYTFHAVGSSITIRRAGKRFGQPYQSAPRGQIGFEGVGAARFRNIKLRPLGLKSIFNGKDLTGWRILPEHKSVFSVTPEGWLNVKNGNGEIQSESKWGDFALQIQVISNGEHLNSGVFFREQQDEFWMGYEAQIRNQWEGDDRTKPVDYGTGAIYNRQTARKVVSSDHEWFTMTVIATGKHIATWVDGYQVTDFTDTRPEDQTNARKGARTAAGVLGLQGHDPTTDLNFRNIRIVEIPGR